jgi:hypothetical protein
MKSMNTDPVVNAIKVQTRQQMHQDAVQRRLLQKIADRKVQVMMNFDSGFIGFVP